MLLGEPDHRRDPDREAFCFCGAVAEPAGSAAKALGVPKSACMGVPCEGDTKDKECGGVETMLAHAFTCDKLEDEEQQPTDHVAAAETMAEFHNPSTSFRCAPISRASD